MIEMFGMQIFQQYDRDRSGSLEMHEFPEMCMAFFRMLGLAPPSLMDIMFLMYIFDTDHDGRISYPEFRNMLYYLGGQRANQGMNRAPVANNMAMSMAPGMGMSMSVAPGYGQQMNRSMF